MMLKSNIGKSFCMSSVYDVLLEKFVENGTMEKPLYTKLLLRNYIHYLDSNSLINREPKHRHVYDYVFDSPPGEQLLIDFEKSLSQK